MENSFALHPEQHPSSEREKALEAKIGTLEERFKSLVNSSTPYYYMFRASGEVMSSAAVIRAQTVLRATASTTGESVDNLRARDNGPVDQIG